jgi:anaerobic selenocysteine-containing dehydrogenase
MIVAQPVVATAIAKHTNRYWSFIVAGRDTKGSVSAGNRHRVAFLSAEATPEGGTLADMTTQYRTCPLCEATCGLAIEVEGERVLGVRGDEEDPFSKGYLCPKAYGLKALHEDPDRLRAPLVRKQGELVEASWDEAFATAIEKLDAVRKQHGDDAVAIYLGNPSAHSLDAMLYGPVLIRALRTKQRYSASTADQMPAQVVAAALYGGGLSIPIPDLDRTDRLMILGGNPLVSNGSLMTAPDVKGRIDGIRKRGGKVIVIDPRRTETAARADEHHAIRPGGDAALLLAMVQVLFDEGLVRLGAAEPHVRNLDAIRAIASRYAPERVAERVGLDAGTIRRLAREHANATSAACYGRLGTTTQEFGTLASWGCNLVNILTGNLDRAGGVMFTNPAVQPGRSGRKERKGVRFGRFASRVKQYPERFGELPIATLADEILTPGAGQVRAIVTVAGNPLVSAPNAGRLAEAFASVDLRIAIDPYVNETTRLADVILPPPSALERAGYDVALYQLAVRNVAKFSPPLFTTESPKEWEILLTLAKGLQGFAQAPLAMADDLVAKEVATRELGDQAAAALDAVKHRRGPDRLLDLLLRAGPHGLTLDTLLDRPHGLDLGALEPRLPDLLATADGQIDLAPPLITDDLPRLDAAIHEKTPEMVLIGRRHLRSNNSWMHNLTPLIKGPDRCTLLVHPDDAKRLGLTDGGRAQVASRTGAVVAPVEVTDELRPGVVSLPHGFGHDTPGARLGVARSHAGVNHNLLTDDALLDVPSGNAAFSGVAVTVTPVDLQSP